MLWELGVGTQWALDGWLRFHSEYPSMIDIRFSDSPPAATCRPPRGPPARRRRVAPRAQR